MKQVTIEIHGGFNSCRIYLWPVPMRPGQHPRDLVANYPHLSKCVGELDHNLEFRYADPVLHPFKGDVQYSYPGTIFEVEIAPEDYDRIFGDTHE